MKRSKHVAIIDDDASMRLAFERFLHVNGISSRAYPSARAFLEGLPSDGVPNCLIVDVNMPEMTGIDLQRELLNRGVHVPTIVVSGSDNSQIASDARSLGAAGFFVKPVPGAVLVAMINSTLKPASADCSGMVIEWLDACRQGNLDELLNLYDREATLKCSCDDVELVGRNSLAIYWKAKLDGKAASAFALNDMILIGDEIQLDCQSCKGTPIRVHFRFNSSGKITHTRCNARPRSV